LRWKKSGEEVQKKKKENETMAPISFTSAARRNETEGNKKYDFVFFSNDETSFSYQNFAGFSRGGETPRLCLFTHLDYFQVRKEAEKKWMARRRPRTGPSVCGF
jgi:hypothetical protein